MPDTITPLSLNELFHQLKLSQQLPVLVEKAIAQRVVQQAAAERHIQTEASELQLAANRFRQKNGLLEAQQTWRWLQKHGLSLDDLEMIIVQEVLAEKLAEHLFADQIEAYFVERQLDYAQAVLYEVILPDYDLAMELFYGLQEQEISFAQVVQQYSSDATHRRVGGYRGALSRKDLKSVVSAAVFAAKPPQLLKPIQSREGVHLIYVEDIIQPILTEELRSQIRSDLFSRWLKKQIGKINLADAIAADIS
jgi:parvulin-like peptidyl-prolyl isomerase